MRFGKQAVEAILTRQGSSSGLRGRAPVHGSRCGAKSVRSGGKAAWRVTCVSENVSGAPGGPGEPGTGKCPNLTLSMTEDVWSGSTIGHRLSVRGVCMAVQESVTATGIAFDAQSFFAPRPTPRAMILPRGPPALGSTRALGPRTISNAASRTALHPQHIASPRFPRSPQISLPAAHPSGCTATLRTS